MTTKALADWLAAVLTEDLGTTAVKGSAAYARPATGIGNAYIEWREADPLDAKRIGQTVTRWATQFQVLVTTANEVNLWAVVDGLKAMTQERTEATTGDARCKVAWATISRALPSEDTIEALRYAVATQVTITE